MYTGSPEMNPGKVAALQKSKHFHQSKIWMKTFDLLVLRTKSIVGINQHSCAIITKKSANRNPTKMKIF